MCFIYKNNTTLHTESHHHFAPLLFIHSCFLPVNLDPLLSWISPKTCMNKDLVSVCLCVAQCIVWRGNVSPTYVHILEVPNLLGINQNTCSESSPCQQLTLFLRWFSSCQALCFPTSVISVIWNQFNNCAWDWFEYANACNISNISNIKKIRVGGARKRTMFITLTIKHCISPSV